ncbi:MAG: hypothetical protein HZA90_07085 [Verrucomicrobia bacterium]|nr:hypothetical protein [Verrucomicrobiota bacterium]
MDIQQFTSGLTLAKTALDILGSAAGLLADPTKREAAKTALEQSKQAFAAAEIAAAQSIGHLICPCDWPSGICVLERDGQWRCLKCGTRSLIPSRRGGGF